MGLRRAWNESIFGLHDRLEGEPSTADLAEPYDPCMRGPYSTATPHLIAGLTEMNLQNVLAGGTVGTSLVGMVAEAVAAPPVVSWTCVALAVVSLFALAVRATYSYAMRRIESRERMALIERGIVPPPLPPFTAAAPALPPVKPPADDRPADAPAKG